MNHGYVFGLKPLRVEMQPKGSQQENVRESVEVAYVGRYIVVGSVAEAGDDRLSADEQIGGNAVDGRLAKTLALLAEVLIVRIDDRIHP